MLSVVQEIEWGEASINAATLKWGILSRPEMAVCK